MWEIENIYLSAKNEVPMRIEISKMSNKRMARKLPIATKKAGGPQAREVATCIK